MGSRAGKNRPFSARQTDIVVHDAFPLVKAKAAPLETPDEDEEDTVIDVLSADLSEDVDIGDAPQPPPLPQSATIRVGRKAQWEEADTTAYKDGMLVDLLEIHARVPRPTRRGAGGRGGR